MIPYSELVLQEALRNAAERQKETEAKYKRIYGEKWQGLASGRVDSPIGPIVVSFERIQAVLATDLDTRTIIKTCWALNGKRIAHDRLVKKLDAASLAL